MARASTNDMLLSGLVSLLSNVQRQIISMTKPCPPSPFAPGIYTFCEGHGIFHSVWALVLYPGSKFARTFVEWDEDNTNMEVLLDLALDTNLPMYKYEVRCSGEFIDIVTDTGHFLGKAAKNSLPTGTKGMISRSGRT